MAATVGDNDKIWVNVSYPMVVSLFGQPQPKLEKAPDPEIELHGPHGPIDFRAAYRAYWVLEEIKKFQREAFMNYGYGTERAVLQDNLAASDKLIGKLQGDVAALKNQNADLLRDLKTAQGSRDVWAKSFHGMADKAEQLQASVESLQGSLRKAYSDLNDERAAKDKLVAALKPNRELQDELACVRTSLEIWRNAFNGLSVQYAQLHDTADGLRVSLGEAKKENDVLKNENETFVSPIINVNISAELSDEDQGEGCDRLAKSVMDRLAKAFGG